MVKFAFYLFYFCWMGWGFLEAAPVVEASVDGLSRQAHFPLSGTITVTHGPKDQIDGHSFEIEGHPLEASLEKEFKISDEIKVAIYHFQLPGHEKGLHLLPSISVKINGQLYQSVPSTYEVKEAAATPSTSSLLFRLDAQVEGAKTLYPGERTILLYRISYNRSVDVTRSILPLVHPAHLKKVGDVQIRDYQQQDITIQELRQEVEARDVGLFQLGPSLIEGYAYTMKAGQKVYDATLLKSEAPAISLEVVPFPLLHQPASFTGALGQIKVYANLESAPSTFIGDTLQLQIKIQGIANLADLRLPILQCQPGFSGFFQMSDLPPLAEVQEGSKIFHIELRPLTSLTNQIPPIEVSSFDPATKQYVTQRTTPIPLSIKIKSFESTSPVSMVIPTPLPIIKQWPPPLLSTLVIKEAVVPLDLIKRGSLVLWLFPLGIALLLLQAFFYQQWQQRPKFQKPLSEQLFQKGFHNLQFLEQAFWNRLWEKNIVPQGTAELDKIPQKYDAIRSFIFQLQVLQYSPNKVFEPFKIKQYAQELFEQI